VASRRWAALGIGFGLSAAVLTYGLVGLGSNLNSTASRYTNAVAFVAGCAVFAMTAAIIPRILRLREFDREFVDSKRRAPTKVEYRQLRGRVLRGPKWIIDALIATTILPGIGALFWGQSLLPNHGHQSLSSPRVLHALLLLAVSGVLLGLGLNLVMAWGMRRQDDGLTPYSG
jgi:hypothetical protein